MPEGALSRVVVSGWMDVVMLNTGGGVAGGDRLDSRSQVGPGARATIAAQAAERFYRALAADAPSRVRTGLTVQAGGLAGMAAAGDDPVRPLRSGPPAGGRSGRDACFLGVETLVFGRTAMGERVRHGWLRDLIRVRRAMATAAA